MEADAATTDEAADGFLAQLQAEQVEEGFASTTFGAFEDNEDELGLADASSESDMSDDELLDTEDEDLDDNDIRKRLNISQRTANRLSKPRYLKIYFIVSILSQLTLFVALFALQSELGKMDSTIVLVLIAGLLLAAQAAQANAHFNYAVLAKAIEDEEKNPAATAEAAANLINRRNRVLKWHGNMIFIPGMVAVFSTIIFLIGIFTVLFHYGITKLEDGTEICASGPMSVWKAMPGEGWFFALWHIATYIPVLGVMGMLSYTHFRAYNDACDRTIEREANEVARGLRKPNDSDDDEGPSVALPEDSPLTSGQFIRELFGVSTAAQMVTYLVLFWARNLRKPEQGETCVDHGWASTEWNHWTGFNRTCHSMRRACYSEGPTGDASTTQLMLQTCCATCADGPIETGGGVMYVILVFGMVFWGYQCGELRTYLKRGKDPLDTAGTFSDHEVTVRFMWHSGSIFYGIIKCIVGTVIYSMVCLSLLYYFVVHDGSCPSSPIQAIWELTSEGWAVWLVVSLCYAPVMACELILAYNHFFLYQKYHTKRAKLEVKNMGRKAAVAMAKQMMRGVVGGGLGTGRTSPANLEAATSPRKSSSARSQSAFSEELQSDGRFEETRRDANPLAQNQEEVGLPSPPNQLGQPATLPSPPPAVPIHPPTQPRVASADDNLDDELADLDALADPSDDMADLDDLDALMGGDMM